MGVLIDLHYFPSLEYFACLLPHEQVQIEACESYQKQTYRNRCYILTSQQVERMTVPVKKGTSRGLIGQVEVDYSTRWAERQWRTLCSAYSKAPYFEYLAEEVQQLWTKRYPNLFELNIAGLRLCLKFLGVEKNIVLSQDYMPQAPSLWLDARNTITPQGRLARSHYFHPTPYPQVFGSCFHPNLSILDLLFCEGPQARFILQQSVAGEPHNRQLSTAE